MANWDNAQTAFLTAAAKVYAALKIAYPSGIYSSTTSPTINVDGVEYQCRCDCAGVIQCIIRVMGYDPNWGVSPVSGHTGDGWYLTDASGPFIKDKTGNVSSDWEVLDFNASDVKPGDIRAASNHSHCDIFVDYRNGNAFGLNAGSTEAIQNSCNAGTQYLNDGNPDDLAVTRTIQDNETAKVLRYVKGANQTPSQIGTTDVSTGGQSLESLDIYLKFIQRIEFYYQILDSAGDYTKYRPGYIPKNARMVRVTPDRGSPVSDSYGDSWLDFVAGYTRRWIAGATEGIDAELEEGLVMMYTLDDSDPLLFGKTVVRNEDGTNDYEGSKGLVPIIHTQWPVHFRSVLTDVATHTKEYGRSSAYFTNDTSNPQGGSGETSLTDLIKAARNCQFVTDASGNIPECEDAHGYLFLHDEDEAYQRDNYEPWVQGIKEE